MTNAEKALKMHEEWNGKLEITAKSTVNNAEDLAIAYTPGVAEPCKEIAQDAEAAYKYTMKANTVAVVSDGSAVLGLGNIGPYAAMPVMEGKAVLFKEFGGVNAIPICLDTQDTEEIIKAVTYLAPGFGGINLEDISAPRCYRCTGRCYQCVKGCRKEQGRLPCGCKRCRKCRCSYHKAPAHLRIPQYRNVRQGGHCV